MTLGNDLFGPPPVQLRGDPEAEEAIEAGKDPVLVATEHPAASIAWAKLAERALADNAIITAYAYARTGYHRGLDQLRKNGWKGFGSVPYDHRPNRGFLRSVAVLARAAQSINEESEYLRCVALLNDCDPRVAKELGVN